MINFSILCFSQDFDTYYSSTENYGRNNTYDSIKSILRVFEKRLKDFNLSLENLQSSTNTYDIDIFSNFSFIRNYNIRLELVNEIKVLLEGFFNSKELSGFNLKFHLINPIGEIFIINDFEKISHNIESLNQFYNEYIIDNFERFQKENEEREKNKKSLLNITNLREYNEELKNIVISQYVGECLSRVMNNNIDENKNEFQECLIQDIISTRKEEYGDDIKNELDLLNKILAKNDMTEKNCKIENCTYNGADISIEDLVSKLLTHVYPEFLTQININDTLDDKYIINTSKGKIIRDRNGISILPLEGKGDDQNEV